MPIISSDYNPPFPFKNGHFSTFYSGLIRKVDGVIQERERIHLPDGDFLDLDWSFSHKPTNKVINPFTWFGRQCPEALYHWQCQTM